MNQTEDATLTRVQIRDILRRHKGSVVEIARSLGVTHATVSLWLKGRVTSARVAAAADAKARELIEEERNAA